MHIRNLQHCLNRSCPDQASFDACRIKTTINQIDDGSAQLDYIFDPRSVVVVGANAMFSPDCSRVDWGNWAGIRRICDHKFGLNAARILRWMIWLLYRIKRQLYLEFAQHNADSATVL